MIGNIDSAVPSGDIGTKWTQHKFDMKLVAPNNRRKCIMLTELGRPVHLFEGHDSKRCRRMR